MHGNALEANSTSKFFVRARNASTNVCARARRSSSTTMYAGVPNSRASSTRVAAAQLQAAVLVDAAGEREGLRELGAGRHHAIGEYGVRWQLTRMAATRHMSPPARSTGWPTCSSRARGAAARRRRVLHGAGSRKENHLDFARLCAARADLAAIVVRPARARRERGRARRGRARRRRGDRRAAARRSAVPARLVDGRLRRARRRRARRRAGGRGDLPGERRAAARGPARAGASTSAPTPPALERVLLDSRPRRRGARARRPTCCCCTPRATTASRSSTPRRCTSSPPGSTLVRVPGGDHNSVQHDSALQRRALDFLLDRAAPERP